MKLQKIDKLEFLEILKKKLNNLQSEETILDCLISFQNQFNIDEGVLASIIKKDSEILNLLETESLKLNLVKNI